VVLEHGAPDVGDAAEACIAVADDGHVPGLRGRFERPGVDHVAEGGESHVGIAEPGRGDAVAGHERGLELAAAGDELGGQRVVHPRHRHAPRRIKNLSEFPRRGAAVVRVRLHRHRVAKWTRAAT
jgi:hypothetical protein